MPNQFGGRQLIADLATVDTNGQWLLDDEFAELASEVLEQKLSGARRAGGPGSHRRRYLSGRLRIYVAGVEWAISSMMMNTKHRAMRTVSTCGTAQRTLECQMYLRF